MGLTMIGSIRIGFVSTFSGAGSTLVGESSILTGFGSALTMGVACVGVTVSIGSGDFGVVTVGTSLMGLGTIGIGFSMELTGFPVGSGVGMVSIIAGIGGVLTTRGSRSRAIDGSMMGCVGAAIGEIIAGATVEGVRLLGVWDKSEPFCKTPWSWSASLISRRTAWTSGSDQSTSLNRALVL